MQDAGCRVQGLVMQGVEEESVGCRVQGVEEEERYPAAAGRFDEPRRLLPPRLSDPSPTRWTVNLN